MRPCSWSCTCATWAWSREAGRRAVRRAQRRHRRDGRREDPARDVARAAHGRPRQRAAGARGCARGGRPSRGRAVARPCGRRWPRTALPTTRTSSSSGGWAPTDDRAPGSADSSSPVSTLAEVGEALVEVHGQGAGFALARPATQLAAVDALAGNDARSRSYRTALAALRELERERDALRQGEATREREVELLRHQADEIERAALEPDEDDRIAATLSRLEHAERLGSLGARGASSSRGRTARPARSRRRTARSSRRSPLDPELAPLVSKLGDLAAEVSELVRDIRAWHDTLDADPVAARRAARAQSVDREPEAPVRRDARRGHRRGSRGARATAAARGADERIATIDADVERARADVDRAAAELTKRRRRAAKQLTKLVAAELPALALPNAVFEVRCDDGPLTESGADVDRVPVRVVAVEDAGADRQDRVRAASCRAR